MKNDNNQINNRYQRYTDLAFQYHIAAAYLWISIFEAPYLFNPCMFLARHTLELLIKSLIYRDCVITTEKKIGTGKHKKTVDSTHDLLSLWDFYLDEKNSDTSLRSDVSDRIRKVIKTISANDMDSTKYRYPETKHPVSNLKLEPIKIDKDISAIPDISKNMPFLVISQNGVDMVTTGKKHIKHGQDIFDVIEDIFQLIEQ